MQALEILYAAERERLKPFAENDTPQGEYASPVFGVGLETAEVMLIGEAPGAEETAAGRPFVGKAGKQLDALLAGAKIERDQLFVTNVVKYRPVVRSIHTTKNRTPSKKEIAAGLDLLRKELELISPKVIVTLGNTPLYAILTLAELPQQMIGSVHGVPMQISIQGTAYTLFALYHPASGIYNRSLLPIMEKDTCALGEHLVKAVKKLEKL